MGITAYGRRVEAEWSMQPCGGFNRPPPAWDVVNDSERDLLLEIISRTKQRVDKAEEAQRLGREIYESLSVNYSRIFDRLVKKLEASTLDFFEKGDTICLKGPPNRQSLLIIANLDGSQPFSTLATLTFLNSISAQPATVYATPKSGPFRVGGGKVDGFTRKLRAFLDARRINLAVLLQDGFLHFDGFYATIFDEKEQPLAARIVAAVGGRGHQTGQFSPIEDNPTFEVIPSSKEVFKTFAESHVPAIGFTGTEDFQALVDGLDYVLSELTNPIN